MQNFSDHFKNKDSIGHVAERQATGLIASNEPHGFEPGGHISAFADAAKDMAAILFMTGALSLGFFFTPPIFLIALFIFSVGFSFWRGGRAGLLGWARLEKLHRILGQERWEIEHNREQERQELKVLYSAKGFEGKLLEDVLDVLMADNDRLLNVMVEEELNLSLESEVHPLIQGLGAFLGALLTAMIVIAADFFFGFTGFVIAALAAIGSASFLSAKNLGNDPIPAIIWRLGLAIVSGGIVYFLSEFARHSLNLA